jgi:hypothetical protein
MLRLLPEPYAEKPTPPCWPSESESESNWNMDSNRIESYQDFSAYQKNQINSNMNSFHFL